MTSLFITMQYLENSPDLPGNGISTLVDRLRLAAERLPISHLLIGWNLPQAVLEACRSESDRLGMRFLRWQPLLTPWNSSAFESSWQVVGLSGRRIPGYQNKLDFTFYCPNHPAVQETLSRRTESLAHAGLYQGFFLDRVRFPSPTIDPLNHLACFCQYCRQKAANEGLDLIEVRRSILRQVREEAGRISLVRALLNGQPEKGDAFQNHLLQDFLAFRQRSVFALLDLITQPLRAAHLEVGLDGFSPSLTPMVGQDLSRLGQQVDWVKLMTYAHTSAPAGLPYELAALVHFLVYATRLGEEQALDLLIESTGLPIHANEAELMGRGLSSQALKTEVLRGMDIISTPVLAGIELVDLPEIVHLDESQIRQDLAAIKSASPAGLAISWDLLHIPLPNLDLVAQVYMHGK